MKLTFIPSMMAEGAAMWVIVSETVAMMGLDTLISGSAGRTGWKLSGR